MSEFNNPLTIEIIPPEPHIFQYRIMSEAVTVEFDADSVDAAEERLHRYASAAPEVQCDLYEWQEVDWSWIASAVESKPLG